MRGALAAGDPEASRVPAPPPALPLPPDAAASALRGSVGPTFVYNVASQALTFGFGVVLARLLAPEDFGLLGMTLVFANVAAVLGNFGLPKALIQAPAVTPAQERAVFTLSLAVSVLAGLLLVALRQPIAGFFGNPVVADLMWLMALNFVLNGLGTVPYAILNRRLELRKLARIDPLTAIVGGIASIALALRGAGVWSLAAGIVVASAARLLLYHAYTRWWPRPGFAFGEAASLLRYGVGATGAAFFGALTANVDFLLIGRILQPFALGIYMRALRVVTIPQVQFSLVVGRLLFPYFARIQEDLERIRRNFLQVVCATALLAFPTLLLLAVTARDFIDVVYGPKWLAAVTPLRILCLAGMVRAVTAFAGPVLDAAGHVRPQAWLQAGYAVAMLGGVVFAARWGIDGVAAALAGASLLLALALLLLLSRRMDLSLRALVEALVPGLVAGAAAAAGAGLAYALAPAGLPAALRLLAAGGLGLGAAALALEGSGMARRNPAYRALRGRLTALRLRGTGRLGERAE